MTATRARAATGVFAILCALGAIVLVFRRTVSDSGVLRFGPWSYSEWLINYEGGFVRRGLVGTALQAAADPSSFLPTTNWLVFLSFASFAAGLATIAILSCRRIVTIALVIFAPGSLITMSTGGGYFYRKEILFHLSTIILALLLMILRRVKTEIAIRLTFYISIGYAGTAITALSLVHEGFLFMSAPSHVLLALVAGIAASSRRPAALGAAVACYALVLFVLSGIFRGTEVTADAIWNSLPPIDRQTIAAATPSGNRLAIDALRWSPVQAMTMSWQVVLSGYAWYWLAAAAVGLYCVLVVSHRLASERAVATRSADWGGSLIALTFVFSLPLYALGWDWGRWISAATVQSLILVMALIPLDPGEAQRLETALGFSKRARLPSPEIAATGFGSASLILIGATFWLPECCLGSGTETFLASMLSLISRFL